MDRKFYIAKHNGIVEAENSQSQSNTINGELINTYANLHQINEHNAKKR